MERGRLRQGLECHLVRIEKIWSALTDPSKIAVGGGSVLEARWDHRTSTDIDLFVRLETMREWTHDKTLERMSRALERQGIEVERFNPAAGWMSGSIEGNPWSIGASRWAHETEPAERSGKTIRAMTEKAIITAKVLGRIAAIEVPRAPAIAQKLRMRDLYDLAVIPACTPGMLDTVIGGLTRTERHLVWVSIDGTSTRDLASDSQKVIAPRYNVNVDRALMALAHAVGGGGEQTMETPARLDPQRNVSHTQSNWW